MGGPKGTWLATLSYPSDTHHSPYPNSGLYQPERAGEAWTTGGAPSAGASAVKGTQKQRLLQGSQCQEGTQWAPPYGRGGAHTQAQRPSKGRAGKRPPTPRTGVVGATRHLAPLKRRPRQAGGPLRPPARQAQAREAAVDGAAKAVRFAADVEALGLGRMHMDERDVQEWVKPPDELQRARMRQLAESRKRRILEANEEGAGSTAMGWLRDFLCEFPDRRMFLDPREVGAPAAEIHAAETRGLLLEFMRMQGPKREKKGERAGKPNKAKTLEGYVSTVFALIENMNDYAFTSTRSSGARRQQAKHMRKEDGAAGERAGGRGFRHRHFARAAAGGFDWQSSRAARRRWGSMHLAHQCLARGGSPGRTGAKPFNWEKGLTCSPKVLVWHRPSEATLGRHAVSVWMMPIKDSTYERKKCCTMVAQRMAGPLDRSDLECPYVAILKAFEDATLGIPESEWHKVALFQDETGYIIGTQDMHDAAQAAFAAAGENPEDAWANAFRIGGASDLLDRYGAGAERLIQERGRWWSDITLLYQRASATAHLMASIDMTEANGVDFEELHPGYRQRHSPRGWW